MAKKLILCISTFALSLIACGGLSLIAPPTLSIEPTWTASALPSPTETATASPTSSPTDTPTVAPSETALPTFTFTPTQTLVPPWVMQGPGEVIVPILLYHHIGYSLKNDSVYYVSPETFDQEMNLLYQWGYKTISVELLVRAITQGAELPPKPILLTFDDGSETTYSTAQPMMQRYGFTGTAYIVYNYVGARNYMSVDQIRALYAAGWEIGSHGLSHVDLTISLRKQESEIIESRRRLQSLLGLPVLSFSYPFGTYDSASLNYVHDAGYIAAMGLGNKTLQGDKNLFYLYRQPVTGTTDLSFFALLLPWRGDTVNLPALTIVP